MGFPNYAGDFQEHIATEFVEGVSQCVDGFMDWKVRNFAFEKATTIEEVEDDFTHSETGSIQLREMVGHTVLKKNSTRTSMSMYNTNRNVCEKEVAKLGRSLKVGRDGQMGKRRRRPSKYTSIGDRNISEETVVVFVRDIGWMESRRLVDGNGIPCTYHFYRKLLKGDKESSDEEDVDVKPDFQFVSQSTKGSARQVGAGLGLGEADVLDLT